MAQAVPLPSESLKREAKRLPLKGQRLKFTFYVSVSAIKFYYLSFQN